MKKITFDVVYEHCMTAFITEVNLKIGQGWILAGSMCATEVMDSNSFYQPIMKSEEVADE